MAMASVSLLDLGLDRLSIEERLRVADAIWDSVVHEVEKSPLPEWQRAELERRLADSVANPDAVRPWGDVETEALVRLREP
jgi:putative addiction module component (TIGR02574 family)